MFTTHTEQLTEMKIQARPGAIDIKHPSGIQQTHSVEDVLRLRAGTIAELVVRHKDLEVQDQWLKDMGSPMPELSLTQAYMKIHNRWLDAGSPENWLLRKGVLVKIIGLSEPKG